MARSRHGADAATGGYDTVSHTLRPERRVRGGADMSLRGAKRIGDHPARGSPARGAPQ